MVFMVSFPPGGPKFSGKSYADLLNEISQRITSQQFETWFRNLPIRIEEPNRIVITASNKFSKAWLERKFRDIITLSARSVFGVDPAVSIILHSESGEDPSGKSSLHWIDAEESAICEEASPARFPTETPLDTETKEPHSDYVDSTPINRDFTFSNFVIGPSNRVAHAASLGVTESVGRTYNPLYIYGGVGLGKTHLLHAIMNRLRESTSLRATYLTSEAFTNQFRTSLERKEVEIFRRSIRSSDILIVDDIQFISKKDQPQDEFFHTFNALTSEAKQVVISSDCAPKEIPGLKERLLSRFKMGLVARIDPPCFETRKLIINKKARARGREIPEPVAEYIAKHIVNNIREIEGALTRLFSLASLQEIPENSSQLITLDLAHAALREIVQEENLNHAVAISEIQKAVAIFYDVKLAELFSNRRNRTLSHARQVCMYLARELTPCSLKEIGEFLGGRNHATVLYSINKIKNIFPQDQRLQSELTLITNRIMASRTVI